MPEVKYSGKNFVGTNSSSPNHGRSANLIVKERKSTVVFRHGMISGNQYSIELDKADTVAELAAQLIACSPKSSLPKLLGAIGEILARED